MAEIRKEALEAGRDPDAIDIACMLVVRLTEDPESIWPSLKQWIVRLLEEPHVGEILLEKGGSHIEKFFWSPVYTVDMRTKLWKEAHPK